MPSLPRWPAISPAELPAELQEDRMQRRQLLQAAAATSLAAFTPVRAQAAPAIVVVGGGFGGATAAKYLRRFLPSARITLVEPQDSFVSCPMSNRVIHGGLRLADITRHYEPFTNRHGLRWVRAAAERIDPAKREVWAGGERLPYDRLVVSPGVDFVYDGIQGMESAAARAAVPHAWKAGPQTQLLREMLQGMRAGGTVAMHIPRTPYRCPPGPYERASLIAYELKQRNPRAKLLVFDSNPEIQSKKALFEQAWKSRYAGLIEYVPNAELEQVDAASGTLVLAVHGRQKADVLNVIPPQRAGAIARNTGLADAGGRWCGVDFLSYESRVHPGVHVLGDSVAASPGMPKSAHMANQQAKVCAGAIASQFLGQKLPDQPIIANTCYSFVSHNEAMHVAAVYRFDAAERTMRAVKGAGGVSEDASVAEGIYAIAWAANILDDSLG
jgi:NADPH-dependent 2,4-dienoyl-CoA reductase/sulfur reductase-like enzyme